MKRLWKIFVRVLRSYSVEEKVISIIVFGIVIFTFAQTVVDFFKSPNSILQDNKSFTEAMVSDHPVVLNPLYVDFNEPTRDIAELVFSGLSKYDPSKQAFVDDMAVLTVSPDKMTYHFVLKPGLLWQDGQPLTADDVYFTFHDIIQSPDFQNPVLKLDFDGVDIKEVDASTIEFKLKTPNAFFITNMNVGILPKHILGQTPVAQLTTAQFNLNPVGSGPYQVDSPVQVFDDGREKVSLKVSPSYYAARPSINQVHITIYPDFETLSREINTVNIISKIPVENFTDVQKLNRFTFTNYQLPQYTAVFFNMNNAILKKDKVRVALMKTIDKQQLLAQLPELSEVDTPLLELNQQDWIYKPNLQEAQGALYDSGYKIDKTKTAPAIPPSSSSQITFSPALTQVLDSTASTQQQTQATQAQIQTQQTQTTQATTQVAQTPPAAVATTTQTQQTLPVRVDSNGKQLSFTLLARAYEDGSEQAMETQKTMDYLKNAWAQLGIAIDVQLVNPDEYLQRLQARNYDMALVGQNLGYNLDTYSFWHSSQATSNGLNLSNYKSFAADQFIEKIRDTFDQTQKETYLKQLAQVISDDVPAIFLYRPKYIFASDNKIQGIALQNLAFPSDIFANISQWCVQCQAK